MLEALYEIGKLQPKEDLLNEIVDDIGTNYKHVFTVVFNLENDNIPIFKEIGYEEFSSEKKLKYFYMRGGSRGCDNTPTSKITQLSKTFNAKILNSVETFLNRNKEFYKIKEDSQLENDFSNKSIKEDKEFLQKLDEEIKNKKDIMLDILKQIAIEHGSVKNEKEEIRDGGIITLKFVENLKEFYVGEKRCFISPFTKSSSNIGLKNYYEKYNTTSKAENKICYICKTNKTEVYGFVSTFQSYTTDKDGMITSGFKKELAWKNYPVCPECAKVLDRGKKYIIENNNHLRLRFCGFNYYLIPQLTIYNSAQLKDMLSKIKFKYESFSLKKDKANRIVQLEEKVIEMLSSENNNVNFNFLFYEEKQSGKVFNILLLLQEIAPSRLKYLIDCKKAVDDLDTHRFNIFNPVTIKVKKEYMEINFEFSFAKIRDFFPNSKFEGNFDKDFLAIVNDIFIGKDIALNFILKRFMDKLRKKFVNDESYGFSALNAYKILIYLEKINLLNRRRYNMDNTGQPYQDFFMESSILDSETKRALFLEGVLAEKLLRIQFQERSSTPFRARLNGLKIDGKIAQRLLPEMINKLEEYKKNYYKELESAISVYMLKANFDKYSLDELSFYFTLGMTLSKHFIKENEMNNDKLTEIKND